MIDPAVVLGSGLRVWEWICAACPLPAPPWNLTRVAPALILYLVLFVTGIPPSEEQALRSRGDDYRRYQRETSAFVPLPPRTD